VSALTPRRSLSELLAALEADGSLADVPREQSWVASDADGTLWNADVAEIAWELALTERLFRPAAVEPVGEVLRGAGGTSSGDPHEDAREIWRLFLAGQVPDGPILRVMATCFAGLSEDEARAFGDRVFQDHLAPKVYAETVPLFRAFAKRGLPLVVVSGSPKFLVEAGVRGLGLEAEVRGVTLSRVDGCLGPEVVPPLTWNQGKIEAIAPLVGASGPLIALGDSQGDRELLLAARHKIMVHPRRSLTAIAEAEAERGGWVLFAPARTANGEPVQTLAMDAWG
jgi:phosphoserine phosphatase